MWNSETFGLSSGEKRPTTLSDHYKYFLKKALEKERWGSGGKAFGYQRRQMNTHAHKIRHTDSQRLKVEEVRQTEAVKSPF